MTGRLRVSTAGISSVTDLGRTAGGAVGQMTGGALDQYSARAANALVAASPQAPLIEIVAADFAAVTSTNLLVALTGAPADVAVNGVPMRQWEPFWWPAGTELTVSSIRLGMRVYLAVHGTLEVPQLLGSCAPDSVLGFSGPLTRGETICVEPGPLRLSHSPLGIPVLRDAVHPSRFAEHWRVPVTDGPDRAEFGASGHRLYAGRFVIGNHSNHIGLRLTPGARASLPVREQSSEVLSRGVPIGAVEVPAGDELLILHRGRGVTAGYPVLAVVTATGLSRLGQARPGQSVEFVRVTLAEAVAAARAEQAVIDGLTRRVGRLLSAQRSPTPQLSLRGEPQAEANTTAAASPGPHRGRASPVSSRSLPRRPRP